MNSKLTINVETEGIRTLIKCWIENGSPRPSIHSKAFENADKAEIHEALLAMMPNLLSGL